VRAGAELHVAAGQPDQLGDAQPGLRGGQEQRVVASSGPGGAVGAGKQRLDLGGGEERDDSLVGAFGGDREHALDQAGVLGMPERAVLEERVDRGQADVARARAVAPLGLEMLEEGADQRRVEV
jgi:hypothetical protein